jgi:hypothetical protein
VVVTVAEIGNAGQCGKRGVLVAKDGFGGGWQAGGYGLDVHGGGHLVGRHSVAVGGGFDGGEIAECDCRGGNL